MCFPGMIVFFLSVAASCAWFRNFDANSALKNNEYAEAADSYLKAIASGGKSPELPYDAALCLANLNRADEAFRHLDMAIEFGWRNCERLQSDADFALLRSDPRWEALVRSCSDSRAKSAQSVGYSLRWDLLGRFAKDQKARTANPPDPLEITRIDADNTAWMKRVVRVHGWPGISLVGPDGAQAAWLLAQHADRDHDFQRECLSLLQAAYENGEATGADVAYLTDRVLVAEGKKQIYGTQFRTEKGESQPYPIEDEGNLDARRRQMGLEPFAEYEQFMKSYSP